MITICSYSITQPQVEYAFTATFPFTLVMFLFNPHPRHSFQFCFESVLFSHFIQCIIWLPEICIHHSALNFLLLLMSHPVSASAWTNHPHSLVSLTVIIPFSNSYFNNIMPSRCSLFVVCLSIPF